jgi:hypothetical protein
VGSAPGPALPKTAARIILESVVNPTVKWEVKQNTNSCNFSEFAGVPQSTLVQFQNKTCSTNKILCIRHGLGEASFTNKDYFALPVVSPLGAGDHKGKGIVVFGAHSQDVVTNQRAVFKAALYEICLNDQQYQELSTATQATMTAATTLSSDRGIFKYYFGDRCNFDRPRNNPNDANVNIAHRSTCSTTNHIGATANFPNAVNFSLKIQGLNADNFPFSKTIWGQPGNTEGAPTFAFYNFLEMHLNDYEKNSTYECENTACKSGCQLPAPLSNTCSTSNIFKGCQNGQWVSNGHWYWQLGRHYDGKPVCSKWKINERAKTGSVCASGVTYIHYDLTEWCLELAANGNYYRAQRLRGKTPYILHTTNN